MKNDVDMVEREYARWKGERADGLPARIDPFELFCAETFLRDHPLSQDDLLSGIVGQSHDGGCDAFFVVVAGRCMRVGEDVPVPEQPGQTINLILMQAKQSDGFSPLQVDRFHTLTDDLLDLSRPPSKYGRTYNDKLLDLITLFKNTFHKLRAPRLVLDYYYCRMVDAVEESDCRASARLITEIAKRHFSRVEVQEFHFINAARFYTQLFARPPFGRKLPFEELADGREGYIGLVRLTDFYTFLKDDKGELMERLFDDNVRGFQLDTRVNDSILASLKNPTGNPEFWLLNNGITILAPRVDRLGGKVFDITDPQIVNGLQTSRQIFDYFKAEEYEGTISKDDKRRIVVRVIEDKEEETREAIIRATNNQNPMPAEAFYTTFRVHRQLEKLFEREGFYYERRKGYWRDKKGRKAISKIISSLSLVQAAVAIILREPNVAKGRPRDYINDDKKRFSIFGHDHYDDGKEMAPEVKEFRPHDFGVYLKCWQIVRAVDNFLDSPELRLDNEAKRNILYYLSLWAACEATQNAYCPPGAVKNIKLPDITTETLKKGLVVVKRIYKRYGGNDEAGKSPRMAKALTKWLIRTYSPPNKVKTRKRAPKKK